MFSTVGTLFKTMFRQAEHADARLEIRRDEKRDGRKSPEFEDKEEDGGLWEDSTDVSVSALKMFLQNFASGKTQAVSGQIEKQESSLSSPAAPLPAPGIPANTMTARAIGAYQQVAPKSAMIPPPAAPIPQSDADLISGEDMRIIYQLMSDLDDISARGVETLHIQKAATFLESLTNAVNAVKNSV
jgi:hypothetical protein